MKCCAHAPTHTYQMCPSEIKIIEVRGGHGGRGGVGMEVEGGGEEEWYRLVIDTWCR